VDAGEREQGRRASVFEVDTGKTQRNPVKQRVEYCSNQLRQ
jgi:hypothetical protein